MQKQSNQQVQPNIVKNSCIALIEALATDATISDEQIRPALEKLDSGTLLAMFCVMRFWALDSFARVTEIGTVLEWKTTFESLNLKLKTLTPTDSSKLATETGDGTSLLFLTTALDALRMIAMAIETRLAPLKIGKGYVTFRDSGTEASLETILKDISPRKSYYEIKGEPLEDRRSDIQIAFLEFIEQAKSTPVGNWGNFPHSVLAGHRAAPHPEWDQIAQTYLGHEVEDSLKDDIPILEGRLENVPLQVRTALRDKYVNLFPQITFKTTGETVKPRNLDLEKMTSEKLREHGGQFNPEILVNTEQMETKQGGVVECIKKCDPRLYWALMKNRTETRVNKTNAAGDLGISRQALEKRIKKLIANVAIDLNLNRHKLEQMIKQILESSNV